MDRYLSREELYALVWSETITALAKKFGLSDVGLAKTCRAADIPLPDRGYWAKVQAGQSPPKPSLPPRGLACGDELIIGPRDHSASRSVGDDVETPLAPPPSFLETLEDVTARATKAVGKPAMPKAFARMHPAIKRLFDADAKRAEKWKESGYRWNLPYFSSPYEQRRLALLNVLALAIAYAGGSLSTQGGAARSLYFRVGAVNLSAKLDAKDAKEPSGYSADATPRDAKMIFTIENHMELGGVSLQWADEDGLKLEKQLRDVAIGILVAGEMSYRAHRLWRYNYDVEERRRREEAALQRRLEAERKERERVARLARERQRQLLLDARNWRRAAEIRAFVEVVKARLGEGEKENRWIEWALGEADRIDPMVEGA